ncbi:hypothetical protein PC9H_001363 [Pleurotus ostreatus]|uniref:Zn(2)-C6 fungal-type domain-containing protein n=1 Tax=Pleurotus ostreatus TaxID=5322 RepID=A0A8H7A5Y2_PLEOS|nr:uncharacterized protein PC9H_001363 [Pleurotus ostreatus]KAF7441014.1 hypothetical protein PC9H_001363 [Pleurotus ostreatus]KAJ8699518.1 hypothetical protein PTI98_002627 [Pleurotus ostreatus]
MSPRSQNAGAPPSTRSSTNTPYPRRPSGQPKSSRQQFSACGACRMRRVRCDLKDLPLDQAGPCPSCSNCKERGLKCVDEFADVKSVKLLRRGRRLQQVERIYGKVSDPDSAEGSSSSSLPSHARPRTIPGLQPEFFASPFWRWFSTQRPIFDSTEFPARFLAHTKGSQILSFEGQILSMLLVVWAYSFGVNERGLEEASSYDFLSLSSAPDFESLTPTSPRNTRRASVNIPPDRELSQNLKSGLDHRRHERRERTDSMLREVMELIDAHSVMRHPTWDGVRILLLILPLMEESHHLDRLMMYEAALAQSHALWTLPSSSGPSPFSQVPDDAMVRLRVYCYAHIQEGIAGGLRGGRLTLDPEDLATIQQSLLSPGYTGDTSHPGSPTFTAAAETSSHSVITTQSCSRARTTPPVSYWHPNYVFSLPLRLSSVCRDIHAVLTGAKAARCQLDIDAEGMRRIWDGLANCWDDFDTVRRQGTSNVTEDGVDLDRFASAWQIFIFECHNIIRETLKHRLTRKACSPPLYSANSPDPSSQHPASSTHNLHAIALHHCSRLLPSIISIVKHHLERGTRDPDGASLFKWDTGLVKDGVFFAGILAAGGESDLQNSRDDHTFKQEDIESLTFSAKAESAQLCLRALSEMRWAYAKSEDRVDTIEHIWENSHRNMQLAPTAEYTSSQDMTPFRHQDQQRLCPLPVYTYNKAVIQSGPHLGLPLSTLNERSGRPPLSVALSPRTYAESAPNTACSTDGSAPIGWASYTPPGTGTSATTSTSTGFSGSDSPVFPARLAGNSMPAFKEGLDDGFYNVATADIEPQFTYNAPMGASGHGLAEPLGYNHHRPSSHHSQHGVGSNAGYLESVGMYMSTGASQVLAHAAEEMNTVTQFTDYY